MPVLRSFSVNAGVIAGERMPNEPDQLYATPEEMGSLFGIRISEASLRFAMSLIHAFCNRPSLWPTEIKFPTIHLADGRLQGRIPITPVIQITDASAGYTYQPRRDRQAANISYWSYAPLFALQGPAAPLLPLSAELIAFEPATGIFTIPWSVGLPGMGFNSINLTAVCGYVEIPARVKTALAEITNSVQARGVSDRVAYSIGRVSRKYAPGSNTFISPQAEQLLQPFVVQALY